jgi:hypothetical protein
MPPVEMQQHVSAYVRVGQLPRPERVFADHHGVLQLLFAAGGTSYVDAWAAQLGMPRPAVSAWGSYVSCSTPGAWYGWSVIVRCDMPAYPPVEVVGYGNRIEVHAAPSDPGSPPAAGPLLGVGMYRPGHDDYLVSLPQQRLFRVGRYDEAVRAIITGRAPAEGRQP